MARAGDPDNVSGGRSLQAAVRRTLRPMARPIKRGARLLGWAVPALAHLARPSSPSERRVLVVYDTSSQPFSVGDLLIFQMAALLLCAKHDVEVADLAVVYDPEHPAPASSVFAGRVDRENVFYHLASLLPVAQVNQRLGSVLVLDSRRQVERHVVDNLDRYVVWPSGWAFSGREYMSPMVFNDLLRSHHAEHGSIPHLTCRPFLRRWAETFYARLVPGRVPVTVNLRNNLGWHVHRNSRFDVWLAFFAHCATRYPATFVIICARSEVDDRLRSCPNVVVAKDHDTGIEHDLALINTSAAHLGASSGPATMAWFNDKPYFMVNTEFKPGAFFATAAMVERVDDDIQRVWFAEPSQRASRSVETLELLTREFALLWRHVDAARWETSNATVFSRDEVPGAWLR